MVKIKRNAGCDPAVAASIVELLMADVGVIRLAPRPAVKPPPPSPPAPPRKLTRKKSKATPEVCDWVNSHHELGPAEICKQVHQRFGVTMCTALVYKIWREARA